MQASANRTEVPHAVTGFDSTTFRATVKKAALNNAGGWTFMAEVPASDRDAFYPVGKVIEVELVFSLYRKSTAKGLA